MADNFIQQISVGGTAYAIRDDEASRVALSARGGLSMIRTPAWIMTQDTTAKDATCYQAAAYEVFARRRTDADYAERAAIEGALLFDQCVVLDGTQTNYGISSKTDADTGVTTKSFRIPYDGNAAADTTASGIVLAAGAQPSYRLTTQNNTQAEHYARMFVWPIGGTTPRIVLTVPVSSGLGQTEEEIRPYLSEHPVTVYMQTADFETAGLIYIAVPAGVLENDVDELKTAAETMSGDIDEMDTRFSGQIETLTARLVSVAENGCDIIDMGEFEPGTLDANGNKGSDGSVSIRSTDFLPVITGNFMINTSNKTVVYLRYYDSEHNPVPTISTKAYGGASASAADHYTYRVDIAAIAAAAGVSTPAYFKYNIRVAPGSQTPPDKNNISVTTVPKLALATDETFGDLQYRFDLERAATGIGTLNTNGTTGGATNYRYTDFIPVNKNTVIKYCMAGGSSVMLLAVYNDAKSLIKHIDGVTAAGDKAVLGTELIEEDGYVRFCYQTGCPRGVIFCGYNLMDEASEPGTLEDGSEDATYAHSGYISAAKGVVIHYRLQAASGVNVIETYNGSGTVNSSVAGAGNTPVAGAVTMPVNGTFRICCQTAYDGLVYMEGFTDLTEMDVSEDNQTEALAAVSARIANVENMLYYPNGHTPAAFFESEISDTVSKVAAAKAADASAITFAFITDSHIDMLNNARNHWDDTVANVYAVDSQVNFDAIVHGGDYITVGNKAEMERLLAKSASSLGCIGRKFFGVIGNHDVNENSSTVEKDHISPNEFGALVLAGINRRMAKQKPYNLGYYVDFDSAKIRLVMVNGIGGHSLSYNPANSSRVWEMLVTAPADYKFILVAHGACANEMADSSINYASTYLHILEPFADRVIMHIHGHRHLDYIGGKAYTGGFYDVCVAQNIPGQEPGTTSNSQPIDTNRAPGATTDENPYTDISAFLNGPVFPSSVVRDGQTYSGRVEGTVTQDLWDAVVVQPTLKHVKLIRFGAGSDYEFDYGTAT